MEIGVVRKNGLRSYPEAFTMENMSHPRFPVDDSPFSRVVTDVSTDGTDDMPLATLECDHTVYFVALTLREAELLCGKRVMCSQCLNEFCINERKAS